MTLELIAPAKLNLTLEVLGRRSDGYHEIASVMQTIDLADRIRLEAAPTLSLEIEGDAANELPADPADNLAMRAAIALRDAAASLGLGARIVLEKRVPAGTGLGGGSSDAAAVLRGLSRLWRLDLDMTALERIAAGIGSDVPFFLHGGTAAVGGRGEVVKELPDIAPLDLTLFVSDVRIDAKTANAYAALTPSDFTDSARTQEAIETLRRGEAITSEHLFNIFDRHVGETTPAVGRAMLACRQSKLDVIACGSGPAFFALKSRATLHEYLLEGLTRECGVRAIACRSLARAESLVLREG